MLVSMGRKPMRLLILGMSWSMVMSAALKAASAGPLKDPGLILWLDSRDVDVVSPRGSFTGAPVFRWIDKSGYGNHAVQQVTEQQPAYFADGSAAGIPFVSFSAAKKQYLRIADGASLDLNHLTAFVVARAESNPANMWLFGKNDFHSRWTGYGIAVEGSSVFPWPHLGLGHSGSASNGYVKLRKSLRGEFALVELSYDGKRLCGALNGRELLQAISGEVKANSRDLLVGAGPQVSPAVEFLQGDIAELLLYNRALSPTEQKQTRQYLVEKYGLRLAPPGEHLPMVVADNGYLPVRIVNPATPETRTLSPGEADDALRRDWLFQAGGRPTVKRVAQEILWARQLAARLRENPDPPDLSRELGELDVLEKRLDNKPEINEVYYQARRIKRRILSQNPVIDFDRLLFIDQPYPRGPEWRHQSVHRMGHRAVPGGRLLILEGLHPGGRLRRLFPPKPGSFWRPELSFDAKSVLFCYKGYDDKSFHLYEIHLDGSGLRQLTRGPYDDIDPIYLPGGQILFTTTRGNTYVRCGPFIYSTVLARSDADGRNVYLISTNSEPDFVPSLLSDGRIIYSRWEYSDKDEVRIQSLWTTNQDGTGTAVFWGNQSLWPDHLAESRAIPGSRRVMFTGVGHHDWFTGSLGIIDPDQGTDFPRGLTKVTCDLPWAEVSSPPVDPCESDQYHASGRYTGYLGPYPLSEEDFLVSARGPDDKFRIYLMDVRGNRELIYEGAYNAWYPIPIRPRPPPPRRPDQVVWPGTGENRKPSEFGTFYNPDVYEGVPELPRGSVKYLRVIHQDAKTYSTWYKAFRNSGPAISIVQSEAVKRIISTVPVEADGSVYFQAPPGKSLYFQLLDNQHRALQTMRSFTGVLPGERRGCMGCHEMQNTSPPAIGLFRSALRREPIPVIPPPWGNESIGYERFVQPVLDRHCGECHQGEGEGREELDLTLRPGWGIFNEPYLTLVGPAIWVPGGWGNASGPLPKPEQPGFGIAAAIEVYRFGGRIKGNDPASLKTLRPLQHLSYKSRLIDLASSGKHYEVRVDPLSLRRLIAWVDANCPYRGEEEIRALEDPEFPGIELLPIRPRLKSAPLVERP